MHSHPPPQAGKPRTAVPVPAPWPDAPTDTLGDTHLDALHEYHADLASRFDPRDARRAERRRRSVDAVVREIVRRQLARLMNGDTP